MSNASSDGNSSALLQQVLDGLSLRAGSFIVTIYGDVVEPRGGRLWMGALIETCGRVGINESLVRTAVSRLVAAGQLEGERAGRRSFYGLTEAARREFLAASQIIFEPTPRLGWSLLWLPPELGDEAGTQLERAGFVRLAPRWYLGSGEAPVAGALCFSAAAKDATLLRSMAASHWDLAAEGEAYRDCLHLFSPIDEALKAGVKLVPDEALLLRLLLVHQFRAAALRDPGLPDEALPKGWPGHLARKLFARLYLALSAGAEMRIAETFESEEGPLPGVTEATRHRAKTLQTNFPSETSSKSITNF
jgi:phenylacetic acid degradation operon negative regulatory protein